MVYGTFWVCLLERKDKVMELLYRPALVNLVLYDGWMDAWDT